jgi:hypothetical protein
LQQRVKRVELALDVWPFWLDVAMDHAASARVARHELVAAHQPALEGDIVPDVRAELLTRECKNGMVAIAAAAFAWTTSMPVSGRVSRGSPS